tara:strand:- start:1363 stop:1647 length:285 start_codon:yes stop_codon:yes gene_type:complete
MSIKDKFICLFLIIFTNVNTMLLTLQFMSFNLEYYMPEGQAFPYQEYLWLMGLGALSVASIWFMFKFFIGNIKPKFTYIPAFSTSVRRRKEVRL